ncbi:MAG: cold shock domain-containing protein [Calditrichia bacterium]
MEKGIVKKFDDYKGFGFIITEDDDEVYFNTRDIHPKYRSRPIREGDTVGFDLKREHRGDRAVNIRLL